MFVAVQFPISSVELWRCFFFALGINGKCIVGLCPIRIGGQELCWQRAMLSPNVVIDGLLGALVVSVNTLNVLFCMFLQPTNK